MIKRPVWLMNIFFRYLCLCLAVSVKVSRCGALHQRKSRGKRCTCSCSAQECSKLRVNDYSYRVFKPINNHHLCVAANINNKKHTNIICAENQLFAK